MLLLYSAILLLLRNRWTIGTLVVTLAISVKMNVLLFVPALAVLLCQRFGAWRALGHLVLMALVQLALGLPFLLVHAGNYFRLAFDFSRAFFYIWTVNLKILDEKTFLSPELAKGLMAAHLVLLVGFIHKMSVEHGMHARSLHRARFVFRIRWHWISLCLVFFFAVSCC